MWQSGAIGVLLASVVAASASATELGFPSSAFGTDYQTTVTEELLNATPLWPETDDNPPVSARTAIKVSSEVASRLVKAPSDWRPRLDGLTLTQSGTRWYWRAQYVWYPKEGGLGGLPPHFDVIVLMNGKAVEPSVVGDK